MKGDLEKGSIFTNIVGYSNVGQWIKFALYGFGFHHANSGTFPRKPWSNVDPIFYVHHAFTFLLNVFGLKKLVESGRVTPPIYGIDKVIEE